MRENLFENLATHKTEDEHLLFFLYDMFRKTGDLISEFVVPFQFEFFVD